MSKGLLFLPLMASTIYKFLISIYSIGIRLASLFNPKAKAFVSGRRKWRKELVEKFKGNRSPIIWFHCASLGEFEQGRPVIEKFKNKHPEYKILLTFFSPSGYEVRKNYDKADFVCYLPIDSESNAKFFVHITNPKLAIIVKYEFWPFYIKALNKNNTPVLSISTILRPSQIYFKWYGGFFRKALSGIKYFFVQNIETKELLKSISIEDVKVSGDTRFDRVWEICSNPKEIPSVEKFKNGATTMVVGSCWPEDLSALTSFINQSKLKFIIAPHEIENKFLKQLKKDFIRKTVKYSELEDVNPSDFDILIIDNIGMLSSLYRYGEYAYVGGGFGSGLHNILEPATFGIPIFFGNKNIHKFREANDLINLGGASAISGHNELRMQFRIFTEEKTYEIASQINRDYVKNNVGATEDIVKYSEKLLEI